MRFFIALTIVLSGLSLQAQKTVGLQKHSSQSYPGYTFFAPMGYDTTYLIDNCGQWVHSWPSEYRPGTWAYLLDDGSIMRAAVLPVSDLNGGGSGGRVEQIAWDGSLLWAYDFYDSTMRQHHDIEPMPNGNLLVGVWERIDTAEVRANGRNPSLIWEDFWSEKIMEVKPIGSDSIEVVWQWRAWDHLVQQYDNTKPNYGIVADQPELIDLNYPGTGPGVTNADWLHFNAIDYHAGLDQIMISVHSTSELWIIDHSTTTAEAAGHTGGNSGMGGDLLYRWGNPRAYDRGTPLDQKLFSQHDTYWIPEGLPGEGNILIYNNGVFRSGGTDFSSVEEIAPPYNGANYALDGSNPYGPDTLVWTYFTTDTFFSRMVSGAQRLPNGNTLICEGGQGHLFEVNNSGEIVWRYTNPISMFGHISQGSLPVNNSAFRAYRYNFDHPAFAGRDLSPKGFLELNPDTSTGCTIPTVSMPTFETVELSIWPNPASTYLHIYTGYQGMQSVNIHSLSGSLLYTEIFSTPQLSVTIDDFPAGLYLLSIQTNEGRQQTLLLIQ